MKSSLQRPEHGHENGGIPRRALAWSVGLHVLALGALAQAPEFAARSLAPATQLHAMLRSAPADPAPHVAASVPDARAAPKVPATRSVLAMQRSTVSDAPRAAASPAPSFAAPAGDVAPPAEAGGIPQPGARPELATAAIASPAEDRGPDAAGLRQFRLALAGEARRYRRYPEAARREGLSGTAEVRVTVESAGAVRQAELSRSSGHAALDEAALEMLRRAAPRAALPEALLGRRFAVLLPVVFEVED